MTRSHGLLLFFFGLCVHLRPLSVYFRINALAVEWDVEWRQVRWEELPCYGEVMAISRCWLNTSGCDRRGDWDHV